MKDRRTCRSGLSTFRSHSATDCQVPSARRPPRTGTLAYGAMNAGSTCDRPCPREPWACRPRSSAGSRSRSAASRSSSLPAPSSISAMPAVACGTNTWSRPSPPPEASPANSAHSPVMSWTVSRPPVRTRMISLFMVRDHRRTPSAGGGGGGRCPGSVPAAGELLACALELIGPLPGPAEGAGGLAAQVGARRAAGEVDVLAPVHPPRVRAVLGLREMLRQLPEEPGHDRGLPALMPERVEPVAEPAGARLGEIVGVAGEAAVHLLGFAVHAQRGVQVVDVELGPLAVAPDLVGRGAVGAVVGALDGMPDLVGGQLAG